jgi:hypothetical protein
MAEDDATNERKVQVVGKSREMRVLSTELMKNFGCGSCARNNVLLPVPSSPFQPPVPGQ